MIHLLFFEQIPPEPITDAGEPIPAPFPETPVTEDTVPVDGVPTSDVNSGDTTVTEPISEPIPDTPVEAPRN